MKKALIIILFGSISQPIFSQSCEWRMTVMGGANRISIGPKPITKRSGPSIFYSMGLIFKNRKTSFTFEPSVAYGRNTYAMEINNSYVVDVKQNSFISVALITGIRLTNSLYYKIGVMANTDLTAQGNCLYARQNNTYLSDPDFEMPGVYYPVETQLSFVNGLTLYCDKAQKIAFELQAQQNVNGILNQNFYVSQHSQTNAAPILIANKRSKPVVLLIGINIKLSTINCFKDVKPRYNKLRAKPYQSVNKEE